tara:strand:- start:1211 stop:1732 length:522 start_codon:yes stop_codon:yes gene_type:complete
MSNKKILESIRNIPDFPKKGIQFKDITTLLEDPYIFNEVIDIFYNEFKDSKIDAIVGVESRGFIFGSPLALKLKTKFVLARKPGKLPSKTIRYDYDLEYGSDAMEVHIDSIKKNDRVLIVDDLLATGGTANAVAKIVENLKGELVSLAFLIKLKSLNGDKKLNPYNIFTIIEY